MALPDLVTKAENYWLQMPDFGEPGKVGEPEQTENTGNTMDPMTQAALINAGSSVLGQAMQGTPASSSSSQYVNFNNSGYTVATSGSKANGGSSIPWWGWVIAGIVAIKVLRPKKG